MGAMTHRGMIELEHTIANGFTKFLEVGNALMEIQARKLYLEDDYATFEQYCAKRWSISRSQAYRMIQAAEVVGHISEGAADVPLPLHEAQTRVLARLKEPEAIRNVWEEVVDEYGETVPAPKVRDAVDYHAALEEKPQRAAWPRGEVIAAYREEQKRASAQPAASEADGSYVDDVDDAPERPAIAARQRDEEEAVVTLTVRDVQNRLSAARQLLALEPAEWALRLDDVIAAEVRIVAHDLRTWCDAMESALRR